MYHTEESRLRLSREIAGEAIVLLKNENRLLPLETGKRIAVLGRTQLDTVIGGGGSGASFSKGTLQILDALKESGLIPVKAFEEYYRKIRREEQEAAQKNEQADMSDFFGLVNSGLIYEIFGRYTPPTEEKLPEESLFSEAAQETDTAVLIIGRSAGGEECDRRRENDYELSAVERELLKRTAEYFPNIVAVLNVNGPIDLRWTRDIPQVRAVFFMGSCGEQGAGALADLMTGLLTPSGRLAQTFACRYEDYPSARHMSYNKEDPEGILTYESYGLTPPDSRDPLIKTRPVTVYQEDLYVGYRYFDSFHKEALYPFGHGMSYAEFETRIRSVKTVRETVRIEVSVQNRSDTFKGKEVVQIYLHAPSVRIERPLRELKAVAKTGLLAPGEEETVSITLPLREFAAYDEAAEAYVIEKGSYMLCTRERIAAEINVPEDIVLEKGAGRIGLRPEYKEKLSLLHREKNSGELPAGLKMQEEGIYRLTLTEACFKKEGNRAPAPDFSEEPPAGRATLFDVQDGRVTLQAFVNQLSAEELAVLCCGYGPGLPFGGIGQNAPNTIRYADGSDIAYGSREDLMPGYMSPALKKYEIASIGYKDGPASVGLTAWPTGMMLGCTFNPGLLYAFGEACGYEASLLKIDGWLAPGLNIIRNPLGGRVFEYFSEDPFLTGLCGVMIARGAMEKNPVTVCPKHFAMNEQETYRRGSSKKEIDAVDSLVSERAAREIYLKPFEMVVREAHPKMLMTSFNKINGTFAAGNRALCTDILRGEWGYDGFIVTDWGDMDYVVDGADAVEAGNDVIMPGGPPVIRQILKGLEEGRVCKTALKTAVYHLLGAVLASESFRQYRNANNLMNRDC